MMWLYAFASNLAWISWLSLFLGISLVLFIIVNRVATHNPVDNDDAERVISYAVKMILFGTVMISIPSQEHLVKVEHEFMTLTYQMYGSRLKELELIEKQKQTEKKDEEIPDLLKRTCSSRVCR